MAITSVTKDSSSLSLLANLVDQPVHDKDPKLEPVLSIHTEENFAHQWLFNDKTVRLVRTGEDLSYEVADLAKKRLQQGPISSVSGLTTDELIECLAESALELDDQLSPHFAANRSALVQWNWEDKILTLIEKGKELIWQLFDKTMKTTSWMAYDNASLYNPSHALKSREYYIERCRLRPVGFILCLLSKTKLDAKKFLDFYIEKYVPIKFLLDKTGNNLPMKSFLEDCIVERLKIENNRLCSLTLKPSSPVISKLDKDKLIDKWVWGFTLVNTATDWHGHAAIIVETVEDAHYHMYKTHLRIEGQKTLDTVPGVVLWNEVDPDSLKYVSKADTWLVTKDKATTMINSIKREVAKQSTGKTAVLFNARGSEAFAKSNKDKPGVHNCITWARNKLRVAGIRLEEGSHGWLFTTPKEYAKPGAKSPLCYIL